MTAQLHWSAAKAGVIGSVFFISCGIGHLINGMLGDRIPVKKFMLLGLAGTLFCNLLIGFFPYCTVILLVWLDLFFFGAISAMLYGVNTLLLTYIPLRLSSYGCPSSVAGLFNFCAYLGAGAAGILLGFFADADGWESTIAVWPALCVLGALAAALGARSRAESTQLSLHRRVFKEDFLWKTKWFLSW